MTPADRHQLLQLCEQGIHAIETIGKGWLAEDAAACTPGRRADGPISGGGPSDATHRAAVGPDRGPDFDDDPTVPNVDVGKYRDRDRLGNRLAHHVRALRDIAESLRPVRPSRECTCCRLDSATHGRSDEGPAMCFDCWRYLKANGVRCDGGVHDRRGRVERCQCPVPECCPGGCGRRADDGPFASECRAYIDARRTA